MCGCGCQGVSVTCLEVGQVLIGPTLEMVYFRHSLGQVTVVELVMEVSGALFELAWPSVNGKPIKAIILIWMVHGCGKYAYSKDVVITQLALILECCRGGGGAYREENRNH